MNLKKTSIRLEKANKQLRQAIKNSGVSATEAAAGLRRLGQLSEKAAAQSTKGNK